MQGPYFFSFFSFEIFVGEGGGIKLRIFFLNELSAIALSHKIITKYIKY